MIKNVGAKTQSQRVQRLIVLSWTCCWMCISIQGWPTSQKWADIGRASSPIHLAHGVLLAPLGLRANSRVFLPYHCPFVTWQLKLCTSVWDLNLLAEITHLVSGLNEAQVLDVSSHKEFSERQSDRYEVDLFRYRERSTLHRQTVGHRRGWMRRWNLVWLVFIGWVISYANE